MTTQSYMPTQYFMPIHSNDKGKVHDWPSIPMRILNEEWAQINHGQSLQRLADRGGLGLSEMAAIIQKRKWCEISDEDSIKVITLALADNKSFYNTAPPPKTVEAPSAGEETCHVCGKTNPVWSAENDLWNEVIGEPNGICCPSCFFELACAKDVDVYFRGTRNPPSAGVEEPPQQQTDSLGVDESDLGVYENYQKATQPTSEALKGEAIGFAEWVANRHEDKNSQTDHPAIWVNFVTRERFTTEQLYSLYIKSKQ